MLNSYLPSEILSWLQIIVIFLLPVLEIYLMENMLDQSCILMKSH